MPEGRSGGKPPLIGEVSPLGDGGVYGEKFDIKTPQSLRDSSPIRGALRNPQSGFCQKQKCLGEAYYVKQ